MSANSSFPGQRDLPIPYWKQRRISPRRLSSEEINKIRVLKRNGFSDREISRIVTRSLGVVAKYTKGMRPVPQPVAPQRIPLVPADKPAAPTPEKVSSPDSGPQMLERLRKLREMITTIETQPSLSLEEQVILARLRKIREISTTIETVGPRVGIPDNPTDRAWRREVEKELETALEHCRLRTHRSISSWDQCVSCRHALAPLPPLA